jgi:hypothetical protein
VETAVEDGSTEQQWEWCCASGEHRGEAIDGLQAYFHHAMYSGRRLEQLDGGGDRPEVANQLTGTDLAALPLLSVRLTPGATWSSSCWRRTSSGSPSWPALPLARRRRGLSVALRATTGYSTTLILAIRLATN